MKGRGVVAVCVGIAAVVCFGVAAAAGTSGAPTFETGRLVAAFPRVGALQEVSAADLTGDGNADVVVTRLIPDHPQPTPISIFAGNGEGDFRDATTQLFDGPVPAVMNPRRLLFADFNGDRRPDIFIADTGWDVTPSPGYPNTLILSQSDGRLADASANLPPESGYTHAAAVGDVNGDGSTDIFAGNLPSGCNGCPKAPPEILLNDGTGHFRIDPQALPDPVTRVDTHYNSAALVDVNNDHSPDLVLGGDRRTENRLLLNDGNGHFHELPNALPAKPWGITSEGLDIATADLNSDGHADLLIAYTKGDPYYKGRWIQVLIGNGDGSFRDETATRLPQSDNVDQWPWKIQIADLNGDGKPDLAVSLYGYPPATPAFYLNKGDGTFAPLASSAFASPPPGMFTLLDANNDGRVDIFGSPWPDGGGNEEQHYLLEQTPTLPAEVSGLRASRGTQRDGVHLSWDRVDGADQYTLARAVGSNRPTTIGSTRSTTYNDRLTRPGVRYRYTVRAINAAGAGPSGSSVVGFRRR